VTKKELQAAVSAAKEETRKALQTVFDALNKGQRSKLGKDKAIAALFDRWGVDREDSP